MKVLLLSRFSRIGSSSRLRLLQYVPYLQDRGIEVTCSPLLGDGYLNALYSGKRPKFGPIISAYVRRLAVLASSHRYDLLWIEKELLPGLPAWPEFLTALFKVPYVVDYDDATFFRYSEHEARPVRALLGDKIDKVMRRSALVIAGNDYLGERARETGARRVEVLPTVVDLTRYRPPSNSNSFGSETFTIGWIGSPFTAKYLAIINSALEEVCARGRARIVLVGSGNVSLGSAPLEIRPWSESREVADVQSFDIGIMPLSNKPWERGKCGYKLIQYMACAKPVIASPVGVNREIVRHGENGFLAETHADWVRSIDGLQSDPQLKSHMGQHARKTVETRYSLQVTAPRMLSLLEEATRRSA